MKKYLILLALTILAACTKEMADDLRPADGRYSMIVKASKMGTKALALVGSTLNATWAEGEEVSVYNVTKGAALSGTLKAQSDGASTTLKGELAGTIAADDELTLKFLSPSYDSQNGTLEYIESHCDYAEATINVKSIAGGNVTTEESSATFTNKQAVVKFTLIDKADGTTHVNATQLTVGDGTNTYTVTPASATNVLYVALPCLSDKTVTLTATDGIYYYHYEKTGVTFENGHYYAISVKTSVLQGSGTNEDPFLISSEADWNYLAVKVNSGTSYANKFFRQTANIDVTTMVGNSSTSKPFSGTYDGDGKTLNLNLNTTESHTAPFRYIVDATIKNVVTTGTVHSTSNHPSGLVGITDGTCTIQNCRVGANAGGAQHSGGIVGHCYHANISIIGCVYSGTLTPASGQWTGGIIGWGGDGGGHTITISNCFFGGSLVGSTKFHPIGILQNQSNTKYLSNTYYTLGAQNTNDDESFVKNLSYKGKFARSISGGTGVTVANAGAATVYNVSGITSYGTGILYDGVLYAGGGEEVGLTLGHGAAQSGYTFTQYTVSGGGTLANPTTNSPTLTMTDANQTINVQWAPPGTINSLFTINAGGTQVYFSQGNLRYTSGAWSFFDNQWDYYTTYSADSWDKFGWSTSATTYGKSTSTTTSDYSGNYVDWGATIGSGWRTLTSAEWTYVFNTRTVNGGTGNGKSYTLGQSVNGKLGIVIYPDNYTGSVYSGSDWASFEAAGCVFLPAAGYRNGTTVSGVGEYGCYWSSALYSSDNPYHLYFHSNGVSPANNDRGRQCGYLVRLVRQVE